MVCSKVCSVECARFTLQFRVGFALFTVVATTAQTWSWLDVNLIRLYCLQSLGSVHGCKMMCDNPFTISAYITNVTMPTYITRVTISAYITIVSKTYPILIQEPRGFTNPCYKQRIPQLVLYLAESEAVRSNQGN